jgi:2,3-bisphosphoglycerate-independent phosphoglycerate mutase
VGTSYRHLLIWDKGEVVPLTQPHDIPNRVIGEYLPEDKQLREMMKKSYAILNNHPINLARKERGLKPANSCWFWGAGTRPSLTSFEEKNKKKGAMISAVDLLKGIAVGASMKVIEVEGANGTLETNYEGKVAAALDVLLKEDYDFVYVHIEAPDEMGHQGSLERKQKAIEYLDKRIIAPIFEGLEKAGVDYRMLIMPDHPTPITIRTHTSDPVPYLLYDSTKTAEAKQHLNDSSKVANAEQHLNASSKVANAKQHYNEKEAAASGHIMEQGHKMMDYFLQNP